MEKFKVENSSTGMKEVSYSDYVDSMYIEFKEESYVYNKIPKALFNEFKNSESKGKFFHKYINKKVIGSNLSDKAPPSLSV